VSADFYQTLSVRPMLGQGLTPGDEGRIGPAVVLSERLWRARFGADPAVIGRSVTVDGVLRVITGVMPSSFDFPDRAEVWLPLNASPFTGPSFSLPVVARLRDDVTLAEASQQVHALGTAPGEPVSIGLALLKDVIVGQSRGPLLIFMATCGHSHKLPGAFNFSVTTTITPPRASGWRVAASRRITWSRQHCATMWKDAIRRWSSCWT
jgi:hypothetical protein